MKVVLFCGGFGTRLREFSETIPKPLVPIGDNQPIVLALMRYYAYYGHCEFVLCLGHRGNLIKNFFLDYRAALLSNFRISLGSKLDILDNHAGIRGWVINLIDTGIRSNIGERLAKVKDYLSEEDYFLANYSDGVTDLDLNAYITWVKERNAIAGFVAAPPPNSLSGVVVSDEGQVTAIDYLSESTLVNAGFFVFRHDIFDYIEPGEELVEQPFRRLIEAGKLFAYPYRGFWRPMDTFKDKKAFDEMFESDHRPWEVWRNGTNGTNT